MNRPPRHRALVLSSGGWHSMKLTGHTYLFTVTDRILTDGALVLLPGIPRGKDAPVVRPGDPLILLNYRGDQITTEVDNIIRDGSTESDALPISVLGEFHRSDISIGTEVYLECLAASEASVAREISPRPEPAVIVPTLRVPHGTGEGFFYKKPCCPNCGSTEVMLMKRKHPFKSVPTLSWLPYHSQRWMIIAFPVVPLIMLQSQHLMKCDTCGADFVRWSRHVRIYRLLLVCFIALYAWVVYEIFLS